MVEIASEVYAFADEIVEKLKNLEKRKTKRSATSKPKPSILVVDDQPMIADTTTEVLNRSGYKAVCAYNGYSALQIAAKLRPDYLLTDVLMPGMNGVELAISIQKELPETKILLFSGQAGITEIVSKARAAGHSFDLLAKPIHPEKLLEHLKLKT
jgi:CheY-like chemotaxis protein